MRAINNKKNKVADKNYGVKFQPTPLKNFSFPSRRKDGAPPSSLNSIYKRPIRSSTHSFCANILYTSLAVASKSGRSRAPAVSMRVCALFSGWSPYVCRGRREKHCGCWG